MKPYFETELGKLYNGDCLEIIPKLEPVDLVLTDPPYYGYENYEWDTVNIEKIMPIGIRSFICWKGENFPLKFSARHVWSKANRNIGKSGEQYEFVYELNGNNTGFVMRHAVIDSEMNATLNGDVFCKHPCQKPIRLFKRILCMSNANKILDPFLGSGTTAVACEQLNRRWIGIEISEKYCELSAKRIERERQQLKMFGPEHDAVKPKQEPLF